jgi:hypothetical protein
VVRIALGPEARAILANPPAFVLDAALDRGGFQLAPRLRWRVAGWIETGQVFAEDFEVLVSEDLLRAGIPGGHVAVRVQHENRVVTDSLDQCPEAYLALLEGFLVAAALGQVACHLGEADQCAIAVAQGGDDDVGPEAGAILADAPAFVFVASVANGALELALRQPRLDGFRWIELREMLADDLAGLVTLDGLGAGIPGGDAPVGVEDQQRVVAHALDEHAELFFTRGLAHQRWTIVGRIPGHATQHSLRRNAHL